MTYKIGQMVKVIKSTHAGVEEGNIGVIDCEKGNSYGVAIYKEWIYRDGNVNRKTKEIRVVYFDSEQLKAI